MFHSNATAFLITLRMGNKCTLSLPYPEEANEGIVVTSNRLDATVKRDVELLSSVCLSSGAGAYGEIYITGFFQILRRLKRKTEKSKVAR